MSSMLIVKFVLNEETIAFTIAEKSGIREGVGHPLLHYSTTPGFCVPVIASTIQGLKKKLEEMLKLCESNEAFFLKPQQLIQEKLEKIVNS